MDSGPRSCVRDPGCRRVCARDRSPGGIESSIADPDWVNYYEDSGNRRKQEIAFVLIGVAGLCFLFFLGSLREALARAEGQSQLLTTTATASGVAFITLATAAHAVHASPAWAKTFYVKDLTIDPDTLRILETVSYSLFAMSLFAASALALATAAIGLLKRAMPAWLAWFGVLAAVAGLFGVLGLPAVVILAWIAALSLSMAWPKRAEVEQTISPAG